MHHHRRRKKRPNYGSIEVSRGEHGFGFTISGQQPCILSCIVPNSPADMAGLRSGDFLISVNGLNVSKLPHESVVQLIGSADRTIRLAVAETYYSDSSDDDELVNQASQVHQRVRPKFPHHKLKMNRNTHNRLSLDGKKASNQLSVEPKPSTSFALEQNCNQSPEMSCNKVPSNASVSPKYDFPFNLEACRTQRSLEYRTVVGYLGTIEMPKQLIATSSKLQTVRSCIRKMRQEKRNPTMVLMTILPHCLTLKNTLNVMLAKYPNSRISFVSGNSENDKRFFGLVTSAMYSDGVMCENGQSVDGDIIISNSCHVFVVDTKLTEHSAHLRKADEFRITCTKDPISDLCLEFPNNAEYVVNLIRSMYTLYTLKPAQQQNENERPPVARQLNMNESPRRMYGDEAAGLLIANSPQPSNHSEITTTSSNSDSGIGFHNDCANISDRILVVDFPGLQNRQIANIRGNLRQPSMLHARPVAIINDRSLLAAGNMRAPGEIASESNYSPIVSLRSKSRSMDLINNASPPNDNNSRQIRAMHASSAVPGCSRYINLPPQMQRHHDHDESSNDMRNRSLQESNHHPFRERPIDVPHSLQFSNPYNLRSSQLAARSCDDVMMAFTGSKQKRKSTGADIQLSIDDVNLLGAAPKPPSKCKDDHVFLPPKPVRKPKKPSSYKQVKAVPFNKCSSKSVVQSPKSLRLCRRASASVENLMTNKQCARDKSDYESIWGSMQDIRRATMDSRSTSTFLEGTYSEPDLTSRALPSNSSPFKRWGQSSFRSRSNETRTPVQRRPSSLAASESDVYTKSIDDDADSLRSRSDLTNTAHNVNGVTAWGSAFEKLLEDPAGLHTFAEFLKKEFSAENIYFWTSCERYRHMDEAERSREAVQIFGKHLGVGASEPVNVDSQARTTAQDNLQKAECDLFMQAQKQIFNLMKFDSYQRFIRSDLYKSCLDAEAKKLPLPYPGDQLDAGLRTHLVSPLSSKLKKSLSNAEDRRRKSLLPWHRKVRCKSKDRGEELRKEAQAIGGTLKVTHSGSDLHSSRSSLSSFDAAISCRTNNQNDCDENKSSLCRVILTDGATTIVQTKPSESIRELVERLLEKRGITYHAYEGFLAGNSKPLDLDGPSVTLAGKEMLIEQRVVFKLDLPNRKVISVKSKPCKALGEVLRPILHKYHYRLDLVQVSSKEYPDTIDMSLPVTVCDGQRLQITCKPGDYPVDIQPITTTTSHSPKVHKKAHHQIAVISSPSSSSSTNHANISSTHHPTLASTFHDPHTATTPTHKTFKPNPQQSHLDEITNKVFNELLQEKVDAHAQHNPSQLRPLSDHGSIRSDDFGGSETSSGIFGRLKRRESNFPIGRTNKAKKTNAPSSTAGSDDGTADGVKKPLIAKWKAGVKLQVTGRTDNHDFLEGLKRAQRFRLEDQRGTEINCELPDFLKDKENFVNNKLRKTKPTEPVPMARTTFEANAVPLVRPQPAPRYSITKSPSSTSMQNGDNSLVATSVKRLSPTDENAPTQKDANSSSYLNVSFTSQLSQTGSTIDECYYDGNIDANNPRGPPPLPPKPKILPIKPSNWGQSPNKSSPPSDRSPQDEFVGGLVKPRNIFMDQASSSFV